MATYLMRFGFCNIENMTRKMKIGRPGRLFIVNSAMLVFCLAVKNIAFAQVKDSVVHSASTKYRHASFLRKFFMGKNYRKEWSVPVAVPVFNLTKSGLEIKELGGGMQTKSLKLEDKNDIEWALRSVDKDAQGALPPNMRKRFFIAVVQDMISASHPYGSLTVGHLAKAAGIVAPQPVLYFVPDDPAFGEYRKTFANTLCFLEEREPTPDRTKAVDTEDVLEEIVEENDHLILQQEVLKARLMDMLVADWDRHADQWKWGIRKKNGNNLYYAIPRDRDQAFFMSRGLVPRIAKLTAMRYISSFTKRSKGLKNLNYKAWKFDKVFLNELDKEQWEKIIKQFQISLTDTVVEAAVKKMPKEVYAISGQKLESRLISRRNTLLQNALKYYDFISGTVDITGTKEKEAFSVFSKGDKLVVQVHRLNKENKKASLIYERAFVPKETGRIFLKGLDGEDQFFVEKGADSKIKVYIEGGKGSDTYDVQGSLRTYINDAKKDKDKLINTNKAKVSLG